MTTSELQVSRFLKWSPAKISEFRKVLLTWYDQEGRQLPWRVDQDPYHIMISELMLQQTQVQTVMPYYQNFLTRFPTVADLANTSETELLNVWAGLGYYSRARNLQRAARQIVIDYQEEWPRTAVELQSLAGIGPYTASAIASISFNEPVAAIDGNAFRVLARLLKIDLDITKPKTRPVFQAIGNQLIDPQRPGEFNQAIMDLGSSYMTAKNPDSIHSPVREFNASWQDGSELNYPVRTKKAKPVLINYYALAIHSPAGWLFEQRPEKGMLAHLWMLPLIKADDLDDQASTSSLQQLATIFTEQSGIQLVLHDANLKPVLHTFTHQKWQITIVTAELTTAENLEFFPGQWVAQADLKNLPMPTVQEKINRRLFEK
ncbi:A/G-specific adenine glycosylase [Lapidilactobacillus bayanensis]|uniref:A/G-specific adenine glycosylase n=1 Tax=Lapidilactobacillus bayanensis TaxID=2485998 RepID=UPI000F7B9A5C|nr:A/G-specific adenine glycosylase [Lapidilactobacillus bayanensis]